jgi:division protein CdvB (Snf7/Vps24/ESCRT-III family)
MNFVGKWKTKENISLSERIKDRILPEEPLKPRLDSASKRVQIQIKKLENAANNFSKRDKSLFAKTIEAYSKHDLLRAKVYANELSEIRKTKRSIVNTKLALEQISLRLGTISEFGDVVGMLSPTVSVLQNIGKGISTTLPETGQELGQIGNLLTGIITESNQGNKIQIDFNTPNDAAKNILKEAAEVVEQNIKQQLPETPVEVSNNSKKVLTKI